MTTTTMKMTTAAAALAMAAVGWGADPPPALGVVDRQSIQLAQSAVREADSKTRAQQAWKLVMETNLEMAQRAQKEAQGRLEAEIKRVEASACKGGKLDLEKWVCQPPQAQPAQAAKPQAEAPAARGAQ